VNDLGLLWVFVDLCLDKLVVWLGEMLLWFVVMGIIMNLVY